MCVARSWNLNVRCHLSMSLSVGHSIVLVLSKFTLHLLSNSTVELHMTDIFLLTASVHGKVPINFKAHMFSTALALKALLVAFPVPVPLLLPSSVAQLIVDNIAI